MPEPQGIQRITCQESIPSPNVAILHRGAEHYHPVTSFLFKKDSLCHACGFFGNFISGMDFFPPSISCDCWLLYSFSFLRRSLTILRKDSWGFLLGCLFFYFCGAIIACSFFFLFSKASEIEGFVWIFLEHWYSLPSSQVSKDSRATRKDSFRIADVLEGFTTHLRISFFPKQTVSVKCLFAWWVVFFLAWNGGWRAVNMIAAWAPSMMFDSAEDAVADSCVKSEPSRVLGNWKPRGFVSLPVS